MPILTTAFQNNAFQTTGFEINPNFGPAFQNTAFQSITGSVAFQTTATAIPPKIIAPPYFEDADTFFGEVIGDFHTIRPNFFLDSWEYIEPPTVKQNFAVTSSPFFGDQKAVVYRRGFPRKNPLLGPTLFKTKFRGF